MNDLTVFAESVLESQTEPQLQIEPDGSVSDEAAEEAAAAAVQAQSSAGGSSESSNEAEIMREKAECVQAALDEADGLLEEAARTHAGLSFSARRVLSAAPD